jgi:hypothetical protein
MAGEEALRIAVAVCRLETSLASRLATWWLANKDRQSARDEQRQEQEQSPLTGNL